MKTWITSNGTCIPLQHIPSPHLVNILNKLKREAKEKIASARGSVSATTSWRDYVPIIFTALEHEAEGRCLDMEQPDEPRSNRRD